MRCLCVPLRQSVSPLARLSLLDVGRSVLHLGLADDRTLTTVVVVGRSGVLGGRVGRPVVDRRV